MAEQLTDIDRLLLARWADTVGMWDAIKEMEDRLADRLEAVAERLRPWLKDLGYVLVDVEPKFAAVNIAKPSWLNKKDEPQIFVAVGGLYPFGYRRVQEEHPYVWVYSDYLDKDEQEAFEAALTARLRKNHAEWLEDPDCSRDSPAGRYIRSFGDAERARLAESEEDMEAFMKRELEPALALGAELDAALQAAKSA